MLRLARSTNQHETLINKTIHSNNIYAFTYLIRFINSTHVNIFDVLIHILNTENASDKLAIIVVNEMIKNNTIQNYIDQILEMIVFTRKVEVLKFLFQSNIIYPDFTFTGGTSLFEECVNLKSETIVNLLLNKYRLDINSKDQYGIPLVIKAVENDSPEISSLFILGKCSLDCYNSEGKSLLELCIRKKWYLHVNYILGNGYKYMYDDVNYFHDMCHLAIEVNSNLIFDKLVTNYFASVIQREWRRRYHDVYK